MTTVRLHFDDPHRMPAEQDQQIDPIPSVGDEVHLIGAGRAYDGVVCRRALRQTESGYLWHAWLKGGWAK